MTKRKLKGKHSPDLFFNPNATAWEKGGEESLFLGESQGLHDGIHLTFPAGREAFQRQVENRWVFDEFNHEDSRLQFLECPPSISSPTQIGLAYQWESDTRAARAMTAVYAPFVTNSQLWEGISEIANMELMHALTYSEINRTCITIPRDVFALAMKSKHILQRSATVAKVFSRTAELGAMLTLERRGHKIHVDKWEAYKSVLLSVFAFYFFERVQFMSSFAATFAVVNDGWFQSIGTAVQKIMQDEYYIHAEFGLNIIKFELATDKGKAAFKELKPVIVQMLKEIIQSELSFNAYLLAEDRRLPGVTLGALNQYTLLNAQAAAQAVGVFDAMGLDVIKYNPLPFMDDWLKMDSFQRARQEMDDNAYLIGVVHDDLTESSQLIHYPF
jgi:ribonucleoside-diphosphate reductase beta chain